MEFKNKVSKFMATDDFYKIFDKNIDKDFENVVIDYILEIEILFVIVGHKYTLDCFRNSNINFLEKKTFNYFFLLPSPLKQF